MLLVFAPLAYGQTFVGVPQFVAVSGGPSGGCTNNQIGADPATGNFYTCNAGTWAVVSGTGSPGGSDTQIQYNHSSAFGGVTKWTTNGTTTFTVAATGILDMHSAATLFYPVSAGCASATTGSICYDTTAKNTHVWINGADAIAAGMTAGITSSYIPKSSSSTIGLFSASALDDGATTSSTLTYSGSGGIVASAGPVKSASDGTHTGLVSIVGNTTVPASYPSNSYGIIGPNSASFTSWFVQPPATAPSSAGIPHYGAVSSQVVAETVSLISMTADITGVTPVANGGTNCSSASVTCFNNITGFTAAGTTGTTSTNLVFSTSPSLTTPALGAATATSLLASGIVDGQAPVDLTTGASASLGGTYKSGYTFNQEATAGTEVTYTLPTAAKGLQYCIANDIVSGTGAADTGILRLNTSAAGQHIHYKGTIGATGGYIRSGGAAGDAGCAVGISTTDWIFYGSQGTWTQDSGG